MLQTDLGIVRGVFSFVCDSKHYSEILDNTNPQFFEVTVVKKNKTKILTHLSWLKTERIYYVIDISCMNFANN